MADRGVKRRAGTSNKRISRVLRKREPKIEEHRLKAPDVVTYNRKNKIYPFEDQTSIEFFAAKNDSALFAHGSHSKKRPNNLIFGRLFDTHVLDMVELGVEEYIGIADFNSAENPGYGAKPAFLFNGAIFETNEDYKAFANIIVDFFRGTVVDKINLYGSSHVIVCSALEDKIHMHHYTVKLLNSGTKIPRVELEESGPELVLTLRRTRLASVDLRKESLRKPSQLRVQKEKNRRNNDEIFTYYLISVRDTDAFGQRRGRVHMQRQDLNTMATRRFKGLKHRKDAETGVDAAEGAGASGGGGGRGKPAKKARSQEQEDA